MDGLGDDESVMATMDARSAVGAMLAEITERDWAGWYLVCCVFFSFLFSFWRRVVFGGAGIFDADTLETMFPSFLLVLLLQLGQID